MSVGCAVSNQLCAIKLCTRKKVQGFFYEHFTKSK
nr:MAG TPA: hypothetical protein [Caudoviricetes sp.]